MYYPSLEEVKKLSAFGNLIPVYREIVADLETPVSAFLKVVGGDYCFLLESVEGGQRQARYSFIGCNPSSVIITSPCDTVDPLAAVRNVLKKYRQVKPFGMPVFCGGAVGYISYETAARFEHIPVPDADPLGLPESVFMLVDTLLVFDHVTNKVLVISNARIDDSVEEAYSQAIERIETLIEKLKVPLAVTRVDPSDTYDREIRSNFTRDDFEKCVEKVRNYIIDGEAIQVVLSQRLTRKTVADSFDIYRALRSINPSPYMYFLHLKDFDIAGASPETLVKVVEGTVMTRPLAGTRPRGSDYVEDNLLAEELLHDEKERAEHIMLVDLGRNDIGRISKPGTVEVSELMEIERYSHVMHMVTHVQGVLKDDCDACEALKACFPAGTVSGAPKIRAMQIIAELEPDRRGPYAGAVGYFSYDGNMDMAIGIRTMLLKGGTASIQAGCGIVYDSVPEREYQETWNKATALLKAIEQAENKITGNKHAGANR